MGGARAGGAPLDPPLKGIVIDYKNAFRSIAQLPLTNRKSDTYNLTLEWS